MYPMRKNLLCTCAVALLVLLPPATLAAASYEDLPGSAGSHADADATVTAAPLGIPILADASVQDGDPQVVVFLGCEGSDSTGYTFTWYDPDGQRLYVYHTEAFNCAGMRIMRA